MSKKYMFKVYEEWQEIFNTLSAEKAGLLIQHIFQYVDGHEVEFEDEALKVAFAVIKKQIDRDIYKQKHISMVRAAAGKKGGKVSGYTRSKKNKKQRTQSENIPTPTLEEIKEYVSDNRLNVDPSYFYNYYQDREWKSGKMRITDWKGAVDFWHKNAKPNQQNKPPRISNYQEQSFTSAI